MFRELFHAAAEKVSGAIQAASSTEHKLDKALRTHDIDGFLHIVELHQNDRAIEGTINKIFGRKIFGGDSELMDIVKLLKRSEFLCEVVNPDEMKSALDHLSDLHRHEKDSFGQRAKDTLRDLEELAEQHPAWKSSSRPWRQVKPDRAMAIASLKRPVVH